MLLRDPQLPRQLLPGDWPGDTARELCTALYAATHRGAEEHVMRVLETADGPLPPERLLDLERDRIEQPDTLAPPDDATEFVSQIQRRTPLDPNAGPLG